MSALTRVMLPEEIKESPEDTCGSTDSDGDSSTTDSDHEDIGVSEWLGKLENSKNEFEKCNPVKFKDGYKYEFNKGNWAALEVYKQLMLECPHRSWRMHCMGSRGHCSQHLSEILDLNASRLLRALSLKIYCSGMLRCRRVQERNSLGHSVPGNLEEEDWCQDFKEMMCWRTKNWRDSKHPARNALEKIAPRYKKNEGHRNPLRRRELVEVDVYWCPLTCHKDMSDFLAFVADLCACPAEDIFEIPVGQVMCQEAWRCNLTVFWLRRMVDLLTVVLLIVMGMYSRVSYVNHEAVPPPLWAARLLFFVNSFNVLLCIIEVVACTILLGNVRHITRSSIVFNWVLEFVIFIMCWYLQLGGLMDDPNDMETPTGNTEKPFRARAADTLIAHPILIASLIIVKWLQVLHKMISTDFFIDSAVPAWSAVISWASRSFMVFLFSSIVGTIFAYFSLPRSAWESKEILPASAWSNGTAFHLWLNDVRHAVSSAVGLTLMGAWDMDAIEGRTRTIRMELVSNSTLNATRTYYDGVDQLHNDLPLLVLANAFLFAVVLLNLYIGILSDEYGRAKERLLELKCRHRLTSSLPNLLIEHWLRKHCCRVWTSHSSIADKSEEGFWFALPKEAEPGDPTGSHSLSFMSP